MTSSANSLGLVLPRNVQNESGGDNRLPLQLKCSTPRIEWGLFKSYRAHLWHPFFGNCTAPTINASLGSASLALTNNPPTQAECLNKEFYMVQCLIRE